VKEFSFNRLGKNILAIRTRLKLTQLDFAALFDHVPGSGDTRRSNVSLYEAGKSRPPMEFVFEIAAKTGFTLDELFGEVLDKRILGRNLAEPGDTYIIGVEAPEPAPQLGLGSGHQGTTDKLAETVHELVFRQNERNNLLARIQALEIRVDELEKAKKGVDK